MLKKSSRRKPEIKPEPAKPDNRGFAMGALFLGAIAMLLMLAGLVISILSEKKNGGAEWQDYDDYGWS